MPRHSSDPSTQRAADIAACRDLLRGGSRTFYTASFLLPKRVREPASVLYAFCRLADDAVDLDDDRQRAVGIFRDRLARAYEGRPLPIPADRALANVVARHAIPRALPEALLEGFEWDVSGRRYEDLAALRDYAARVAGSVGAMMALLMDAREPEVVARACDLGVAMQLSNVARDVGEDARAGRLYLPLSWLRDAGIDPERWLAQPVFGEALRSVIERVLGAADQLYARVDEGIACLPSTCRPGIRAARLLYAEIGHEVARRGYDSVSQRAAVSGMRKVALLSRAVVASRITGRDGAPALDQTRYLVEAAATTRRHAVTRERPVPRRVSGRSLMDRVVWVIDLFERLERRDRMQRPRATS